MGLFAADQLPRAKRVNRMHVHDAGEAMIEFQCGHCGHNTGWIANEWTITEAKRGLPCPQCAAAQAQKGGE